MLSWPFLARRTLLAGLLTGLSWLTFAVGLSGRLARLLAWLVAITFSAFRLPLLIIGALAF